MAVQWVTLSIVIVIVFVILIRMSLHACSVADRGLMDAAGRGATNEPHKHRNNLQQQRLTNSIVLYPPFRDQHIQTCATKRRAS